MFDQVYIDRFWSRVAKSDDCWEWTAGVSGPGYGTFWAHGQTWTTHRFSWTLANGCAIPTGAHICHHCDNPLCVRPDHLYAGTPKTNARDAIDRGRNSVPSPRFGDDHPHALPSSLVKDVVSEYAKGELTKAEVAEKFGLAVRTVDHWTRGHRSDSQGVHVRDGRFKPSGQGCGTRAGYSAHGRRGEPFCAPCKQANSDYMRAYKAKRYIKTYLAPEFAEQVAS